MVEGTENITNEGIASPEENEGLFARLLALPHNKEMERFLKFAVVGAIGAVIDFGIFTALNRLGVLDNTRLQLPFGLAMTGVGIAGTIAFTAAVISNFIWNRFWTYPDSRSKSILYQFVTFFGINVVGILIRVPILEIGSRPLADLAANIIPSLGAETAEWAGETGAWGIAVVIVMFWNFFVNRYWTYNDVD